MLRFVRIVRVVRIVVSTFAQQLKKFEQLELPGAKTRSQVPGKTPGSTEALLNSHLAISIVSKKTAGFIFKKSNPEVCSIKFSIGIVI